jgi:hypothetical protein
MKKIWTPRLFPGEPLVDNEYWEAIDSIGQQKKFLNSALGFQDISIMQKRS